MSAKADFITGIRPLAAPRTIEKTYAEIAEEKLSRREEPGVPAPDAPGGGAGDAGAMFAPREPLYEMKRLILAPDVLKRLATLKARFSHHALVYDTWALGKVDPAGRHIAFNLYGPPGTGKTMCVEALANEWGKKIIDVNYAEIESKYVGETGKNITAAFEAARKSGAILFFDEADSILGQRMTSVTQAADQAVNVARAVMLKQLDAFDGIVAFATNLAKNFDSAFVRRIPIHVEIPLPGCDQRRRIMECLVPKEVPFRDKIPFEKLAGESDGLSGGDLKNALVNGICEMASHVWQDMDPEAVGKLFSEQIEAVRRAKAAVGRTVVVKDEVVPLKEVSHG